MILRSYVKSILAICNDILEICSVKTINIKQKF